jgi:hypothetical protein
VNADHLSGGHKRLAKTILRRIEAQVANKDFPGNGEASYRLRQASMARPDTHSWTVAFQQWAIATLEVTTARLQPLP